MESRRPNDRRGGAPQSTVGGRGAARSLDFDPQAFLNIGSWLAVTDRRQTSTSVGVQCDTPEAPPRPLLPRALVTGCIFALLALSGYLWGEARAWQGKHAELRREFEILASAHSRGGALPPTPPKDGTDLCFGGGGRAGGEDIISTCWVKVQLGECGKDLLLDPLKLVAGAWHDLEASFWETWSILGSAMTHACHDFSGNTGEEDGREEEGDTSAWTGKNHAAATAAAARQPSLFHGVAKALERGFAHSRFGS